MKITAAERLKAETSAIHARLDARLPLAGLDRQAYERFLVGLYRAHTVLAGALRPHAAAFSAYDYHRSAQEKIDWLREDLAMLGNGCIDEVPSQTCELTVEKALAQFT